MLIMWRIVFIVYFIVPFSYGQVGINTTDPQQAVHLGTPSGTLRVESLNAVNNSFNGGDVENDGDLTNNTFPLYIDENGEFTLELSTYANSEDLDALDDTVLPTSTVSLLSGDLDGKESTEVVSYSITVGRATILEVRYSLSFAVYLNATNSIINDNFSRRISSYVTATGQTRQYGVVSKCYTSGSTSSKFGEMYNSTSTYISLPAAGTYDIKLIGEVSTNIKGIGPGTESQPTYVEFAIGNDLVFIRMH